MYVGDGEGLLREIFQKARLAGKSIIFFDEADIVAGKRLVSFLCMCYGKKSEKLLCCCGSFTHRDNILSFHD